MKRYLLIIAGVFFLSGLNAQMNVFDCGMYHQDLSPSQVSSQQVINGSCITLGTNGAIQVSNSASKSVFASQGITLKNDVHIGAFDTDGGVHLKITGKAGLEVVVMNYTDLYGVLRYKKAEFGIRLPDDILTRINHFLQEEGIHQNELNPFLEWNIDVEATFTHPASGMVRKVDGYYTREYSENSQDDWDDIGTDYPFRVRFAPPLNGDWLAEISIRIDNEQQSAYTSDLFGFNVVESGDPGYVRVHENGRNLKRGDKMIIATGMNFVSPDDHAMAWGGAGNDNYIGEHLFGVGNTEKACNTKEWAYFRQKVEQFFQDGGKYIKTIQFPWSSLIEFEKKGNYYKRLHYAWEQDKLLDLCEQYDVLMLFDLLYQVSLEKGSGYNMWPWDWDNYIYNDTAVKHPSKLPSYSDGTSGYYDYPVYCYNDDPSWRSGSTVHDGKKPYEMFTNASDLAYHKQRTRYYVARYGYSTKIFEFEMLSEPWSLNSEPGAIPYDSLTHPEHTATRNAVKNYHEVISEYLKDTLKVNQLVGIDVHYWNDRPVDQLEESIELSKIDIVGTNPYYAAPNAAFSFYDYVQKIQEKHGSTIPVILAEGGVDEKYTECSAHSQHPVDMMTFPFTGVAGYFTWFGMQEGSEHLWPATIRAQQHMDGTHVIETLSEGGGKWGHGIQEARLKEEISGKSQYLVENQYYGGYNANTTVGYIRNRTYNIHTTGCNAVTFPFLDDPRFYQLTSISKSDIKTSDKITIISLKNLTHYYIDWYSFKDGDYLKTDYLKTDFNGTLELDFPTLSDENPVLWYVVHQNAYSGMIQNEIPMVTEDRMVFDFQPIENDTTNISFSNAIYPNPFHNTITVNSLEDDSFVISTLTGSVIKHISVHKGTNNLFVGDLPKGLYFGELRNQRFIIKLERL